MVESNSLVFLDTDVLINWLTHERESHSDRPLWPAVEKILLTIQNKKLKGATSIASIMELRTFLRRDKKITKAHIETEIAKINSLLSILVPNDITMLLANQIQSAASLTPIDAIQIALIQENLPAIFVSRDKELLFTAKHFVTAFTPEQILMKLA